MDRKSPEGLSLQQRLGRVDDRVCTTIVCLEEQLRGLLALIRSVKDTRYEIPYYLRLQSFIADTSNWDVLPLGEPAVDRFFQLKKAGVQIGTMDLKIASIALVEGGLLLSRNLRDFQKIPELKVEDWLQA